MWININAVRSFTAVQVELTQVALFYSLFRAGSNTVNTEQSGLYSKHKGNTTTWIHVPLKKGKGTYSSLWINPWQSYRASPAIWDHTVYFRHTGDTRDGTRSWFLTSKFQTGHRWARLTLTPAMQAGTRFTYPGGMKGWVDLDVGYIPR